MVLAEIPGGEEAVFLERPNRFLLIALRSSGEKVKVHVPDPGRLHELLFPGNRILILPAGGSRRKTAWSLLGAAGSDREWVLTNTTYHRQIAAKLFTSPFSPFGIAESVRAEVKSPSGRSRFDFFLGGELWVEVKGCTLKMNDLALFPDAPTARGRKHVLELSEMSRGGIRTAVVFLVFVQGVRCFTVNRYTDPAFGEALDIAVRSGVAVECVQLLFNGSSVEYKGILEFSRDP